MTSWRERRNERRRAQREQAFKDLADVVLEALDLAMDGDTRAAVLLLLDACRTPDDGYAACCAMANIVVETSKRVDGAGDGPMRIELEITKAMAPASSMALSDVAGFIAAVGNGDYEGALTVFKEATCTMGQHRRFGEFLAALTSITAAVVRDVATATGGVD